MQGEKGAPCDGPDGDKCKNGSWSCNSDKTDVECINETKTEIAEICDGQDNDCDGKTDVPLQAN